MQVVCETEYQDIYRIKDGVLLVVNKFEPIDYSDKTERFIHIYSSKKMSRYAKECQDCLKVLKNDYYEEYSGITIPKGTVLCRGIPVKLITNKSRYEYQIKTTGEMFSGNAEKMTEYINNIINVIKQN